MVLPSLLGNTTRQDLYICSRCAFKASKISSKTPRRWIGQKYLAKVAQAEQQWQEQAVEIRAGRKKDMLTILEERGLVHQITGYMSLSIQIK
jgi:tyrosyl-tRNA synthetase